MNRIAYPINAIFMHACTIFKVRLFLEFLTEMKILVY